AAPKRLGPRLSPPPQRIELAWKRAVDAAQLAELTAEPLALLLTRFERAPQAVALLDQRRNHMAELILAFSEPAGGPLRVVDGLDVTHLAWCLLVRGAWLRVGCRGRGGDFGCQDFGREPDQLVRRAGHQRRAPAATIDGRRAVRRFVLDSAAPVEHDPDLGIAEMAIAEMLVDRRLRSRDNDQISRHAASVRFLRRERRFGEVGDHLAEQRTEEQEMHYGVATLPQPSSRFIVWRIEAA